MIEVRDLAKSYDGFHALKGISFTVERGEIVGFLGPNGAGKTTTMKILTGFMPQSSGTVTVDGKDINADSLAVRAEMGYLPESNPLYTDMLVYDYLRHVATVQGVPKAKLKERIKAAAEMCGIAHRVGDRIGNLSKGLKQRVGLAGALIHDPRILILDEPTSGLDPNQIVEIRNLIKKLGQDRTIILSTHNLPEVMATCSRMLIIHNGALVADGTAADLQAREAESRRLTVIIATGDGNGAGSADVKAALEGLSGVEAVTTLPATDPGAVSYDVLTHEDHDVRRAVFDLVTSRGWALLELRRDVLDLEGIFRKLTREI